MRFWLGSALRELVVNKGFSLFFILNLAVGLAGFVAVQSFGRSLDRHVEKNLKEILTADLVLAAASPMTPSETGLVDSVLGPDRRKTRLVSFYTMVRFEGSGAGRARLVRVMAAGPDWPLYGEFRLEGRAKDLGSGPSLFMTRDTAQSLGLEAGQPLRIGDNTFFFRDYLREDPDKSVTGVDLAPKIYLRLDQIEATGLIRFGSRVRYLYFYAFGGDRDIPALAARLSHRLFDSSQGNPRIKVYDARNVNRRLGRLTGYVTGYMGLVSIVALFLAGMSAAYLFRGVAAMKQKEIAILMSVGAVRRDVYGFVSIQLVILGTAAALLAVAAAFLLLPAFPVIFKGLVPGDLKLALDPLSVCLALGLGAGGSLVFCLPVFVSLFRVSPLMLLSGQPAQEKNNGLWRSWPVAVSFIPGILAFLSVAVLAAGSPKEGMIFAAGFALAMTILFAAGLFVFRICRILALRIPHRFLSATIALRNLFRHLWASLSCFVTIAMGVFLIALIPQVQQGLESEIMRPRGLKLPVFFLVDIQDEQKAELMAFMAAQPGELTHISPMVRGRILEVNDQPFFGKDEKDGVSARDRTGRGRRLEFNFSFRDRLADSEVLVKGEPLPEEPWAFGSDKPFGVSMAVSFADRYGLKIGDVIRFDVQGIPLTGEVKNLRKVRWNSFQPNFFLLFQNGVLNNAPKTHLGAISDVAPKFRNDLKSLLVERFPNVSVIDVTQTAATILSVTERLSLSVRFMAWLAIAAGLVAIFSIARHQARKNRNQINLLKVLGAGQGALKAVTLIEFGFIGFLASFFALVLSMAFSWGISWYFFDSLWHLAPGYPALILLLSTGICMATGLLAVRQVMRQNPLDLLNAAD